MSNVELPGVAGARVYGEVEIAMKRSVKGEWCDILPSRCAFRVVISQPGKGFLRGRPLRRPFSLRTSGCWSEKFVSRPLHLNSISMLRVRFAKRTVRAFLSFSFWGNWTVPVNYLKILVKKSRGFCSSFYRNNSTFYPLRSRFCWDNSTVCALF